MAKKLEAGTVRIAHVTSDGSSNDDVVVAEFDDRGVIVSWPRPLDFVDALSLNYLEAEAPQTLILRDKEGWLTLSDAQGLGGSVTSRAHVIRRLRYRRAIATGKNGANYREINGMISEIDGLAKWSKLCPVTVENLFSEKGELESTAIVAKNLDPLPLGGPFNLQLVSFCEPEFTQKGGIFSISTALRIKTFSDELESWQLHQQTHMMMQDLMCLVYGNPCRSRLISVMREDDQVGPSNDERRYWRQAYQPFFGRTVEAESQLAQENDPLFYLDETMPDRVAAWFSEFSCWSRPIWIAVSTMFIRNLPAKSFLLQIAVALEALGYAILMKRNPERRPSGTYESLLKNIFDYLGYCPASVVRESGSPEAWCRAFNAAYKGVKHADNELTESYEARRRANEGLVLIRCWLAAELGVSEELISERLRSGRTANN